MEPCKRSNYISSSSTYEIDISFVNDLLDDAGPLWGCDDANFVPLSSGGGFEVANADSGELLYELGLRDGDELLTLNGQSMENYYDIGVIATELQSAGIAAGKTYTLRVVRRTNIITLSYELI